MTKNILFLYPLIPWKIVKTIAHRKKIPSDGVETCKYFFIQNIFMEKTKKKPYKIFWKMYKKEKSFIRTTNKNLSSALTIIIL